MRVTRTASEEGLFDLVERPPRAYLAYVRDGRVEAVPVLARRAEDVWLIHGAQVLPPGRAMLLIDDGVYYFELRGLRYPGVLMSPEAGHDEQRFLPDKAIGWHYGTMRKMGPS
jgi:hypothetical protein